MLLGTSAASLLESAISVQGVIKAGERTIRRAVENCLIL